MGVSERQSIARTTKGVPLDLMVERRVPLWFIDRRNFEQTTRITVGRGYVIETSTPEPSKLNRTPAWLAAEEKEA